MTELFTLNKLLVDSLPESNGRACAKLHTNLRKSGSRRRRALLRRGCGNWRYVDYRTRNSESHIEKARASNLVCIPLCITKDAPERVAISRILLIAIGAFCISLMAGLQTPDADGGIHGDWSQTVSVRSTHEVSFAERSSAIAKSVAQGDAELIMLVELP